MYEDYLKELLDAVSLPQTEQPDAYSALYDELIRNAQQQYQTQMQAARTWQDQQTEQQNQQLSQYMWEVAAQKQDTRKAYEKEQSEAYVSWKKNSSDYGNQAEQLAQAGLTGSGYSESMQVSLYNTYQNRVEGIRQSYHQAMVSYETAIRQARLQNSAALAQIAYDSLQQQMTLVLQGMKHIQSLQTQKMDHLNERIRLALQLWQEQKSQEAKQAELELKAQMAQAEQQAKQAELELKAQMAQAEQQAKQAEREWKAQQAKP